MKNIYYSFFIVAFLFSCADPEPETQPVRSEKERAVYGIESGIVEIVYDAEGTKDKLYFERWGTRSAEFHYKSFVEGQVAKLRSIKIVDGGKEFEINMDEMTGNISKADEEDGTANKVIGYPAERRLRMLNANIKIGTGTVAGKLCDVWKMDDDSADMKTYVYKGIILKEILVRKGDTIGPISIKITENIKVPEEKFMVPEGVNMK